MAKDFKEMPDANIPWIDANFNGSTEKALI